MKIYLALTYGLLLALTFLPVRELYRNIPDDNSYFFRNNQIGGGDFIAFYLAGKMFEQNRANLYNLAEQQQFRTETLGVLTQQLGGDLPFVYPAPVALFASVFSRAPFWTAYFLWMLFGFSVSVAALAKCSPPIARDGG